MDGPEKDAEKPLELVSEPAVRRGAPRQAAQADWQPAGIPPEGRGIRDLPFRIALPDQFSENGRALLRLHADVDDHEDRLQALEGEEPFRWAGGIDDAGWELHLSTLVIVPAARADMPGATVMPGMPDGTACIELDLEAETAVWTTEPVTIPKPPNQWRIPVAGLKGTIILTRI